LRWRLGNEATEDTGMKQWWTQNCADVAVIAGAAVMCGGLTMVWVPLGVIWAGMSLLGAGLFLALTEKQA
jgi:hypothetical protein